MLKLQDGSVFYEDAKRTATILYKRIKEIADPFGDYEAEALKEILIKMANDRGIPQTNKRPR